MVKNKQAKTPKVATAVATSQQPDSNKTVLTANDTDMKPSPTYKAKNKLVLSKTVGGNISQSAIEFTRDSKYFFSGVGSAIKIYSIATGAAVKVLSRSSTEGSHKDKVTAVLLNPKNPLQLFSASLDGTIKLWDYNDEILLKTFDLRVPITEFILSPADPEHAYLLANPQLTKKKSGNHLETMSKTKVYQYNLDVTATESNDKNRPRLVAEFNNGQCLAISSDGKYLAIGSLNTLYIWTTNHGEGEVSSTELKSYSVREGITQLAFNPTKLSLAVGQQSGRITFYHCFTDKTRDKPELTQYHWHASAVRSLKFMEDGNYLLSGGSESVLVVWQLETGFRRFFPRMGGPIDYINITPDHKHFCLSLGDNSIRLINGVSQTVEQIIQGVQQWDGRKHQLELQEQQLDRTYNTRSTNLVWSQGMMVDPRNHHLVLNGSPGSLQFYDSKVDNHALELEIIPNNRNVQQASGGILGAVDRGHVAMVAFSPNGEWMATVDMRNDQVTSIEVYLKFWQWDHDQQTYVLHTRVDRPHSEEITSLSFHPSASSPIAVTTSMDKTFKVWHLSGSTLAMSLEEVAWSCRSVGVYRNFWPSASAFSADGSMLTVAFGPVITIWDPYQNTIQGTLSTPEVDYIRSLHFVNDTPYLISRSKSHLFIWNLLTCTVWWSYQMPTRYVSVDPRADRFVTVVEDEDDQVSQLVMFEPSSPQPLLVQALDFVCQGVAWVPSIYDSHHHHHTTDTKKHTSIDSSSSSSSSDLAYLQPNHTIKLMSVVNVSKEEKTTKKQQETKAAPLPSTAEETGLFDDAYGTRQQQKTKDALQTQARIQANTVAREDAARGKKRNGIKTQRQTETVLDAPSHILPSVDSMFETFMSALMDLQVSDHPHPHHQEQTESQANGHADEMEWTASDQHTAPSSSPSALSTKAAATADTNTPKFAISSLDPLPLLDAYFASVTGDTALSVPLTAANDTSSSDTESDDGDEDDDDDVENIDW